MQEPLQEQQVQYLNYYTLLDLTPAASQDEIRRAYRQKSKLYHPDTTVLPREEAVHKFQQLKDAYTVLSSPERRLRYDRQISFPLDTGLTNFPSSPLKREYTSPSSSAYLDPHDRPLSPGELFALFILALTFVGCLVLAIVVGITRGEVIIKTAQETPGFVQVLSHGWSKPQVTPAPAIARPHPDALKREPLKRKAVVGLKEGAPSATPTPSPASTPIYNYLKQSWPE